MDEYVTLAAGAVNAPRLLEELEAALGVSVRLQTAPAGRDDLRTEVRLSRKDGAALSGAEQDTIASAISVHNPAALAAVQTALRDREIARAKALDTLRAVNADALRPAVEGAATLDALRTASATLADLIAALVVLVRTGHGA